MTNFAIRLANYDDLDKILDIYAYARTFMANTGNPNQWINGHPNKELLLSDIEESQLYVVLNGVELCGVFALIYGNDPTYNEIDGRWVSDTPYGTIHRLASSGKVKGVFDFAIAYCYAKIQHLRIDTHQDNKIMQHLILKNGFKKCGIIHILSGDSRIAYERV